MNANTSNPSPSSSLLPLELVTHQIKVLRGQRVIMDADLAALYGVETKRFNEAVKRNTEKFPSDFMFQLTAEEFANLRSQIATSSLDGSDVGHGGRRYLPRVFTEHGALMAATVLSSPRAVEVSIYVVRAFVQLRDMANTHQGLAQRLDALEEKTEALTMSHDTFSRNTRNQLRQVFEALRELAAPADPPKRPIGFIAPEDKPSKPTSSKAKATGKKT
ncbi:MAG: ORF6N domain-containing protein [Rhodoferax sp.]|nr:ORF6N domain-containing protein [Rhodoferax sp.]